jgi:hypothetical protein
MSQSEISTVLRLLIFCLGNQAYALTPDRRRNQSVPWRRPRQRNGNFNYAPKKKDKIDYTTRLTCDDCEH